MTYFLRHLYTKTIFFQDNQVQKCHNLDKAPSILIFVDGPPHTPDNVKEEDSEKRDKIES